MNGAKASMNSKRSKFVRRGQHKAALSFDAGRYRHQVSGNWKQSHDRYLALAQAAASSGDTIAAENYCQHAEHYLRLMHEVA